MKILFTICGRAGSKGFKNKNLKNLKGIPLVYYTLAAIRLYIDHHPDDDIIVALNTDSIELREVVSSQNNVGNILYIDRKPELAGDNVAKVEVIKDTFGLVRELLLDYANALDVVIDLDITSPMRSCEDIEKAIGEFLSNRECDLVLSVVESRRSPYFNMVEKNEKFYRKICKSDFVTRQETPKTYELNASIYVYNPEFLDGNIENTILDNKCGITVMKDYLVLDIDSEEDYKLMEYLYDYYCDNDEGICKIRSIAEHMYRGDNL